MDCRHVFIKNKMSWKDLQCNQLFLSVTSTKRKFILMHIRLKEDHALKKFTLKRVFMVNLIVIKFLKSATL